MHSLQRSHQVLRDIVIGILLEQGNPDSMFRHPAQDGHRVGPFLALLAASGSHLVPAAVDVITGSGVSR